MNKEELRIYIGKKIKYYRNKKNLNQNELGKKIGVGNTTISAYERGVISQDADTLYQLANILDVNVDDFFPPLEADEAYLEKIKEKRSEKIDSNDMYFFQKLAEKTASMNEEEKNKFLESIKFTVEYYDRMNRND